MTDLDSSLIAPADLTERREMLAELESVEREMKTERWSARQEEANLLVAFRGGEPPYVPVGASESEIAYGDRARACSFMRSLRSSRASRSMRFSSIPSADRGA